VTTFITNRKMDPALRERIEASIREKRSTALPRALVRLGIAITIGVAIASFILKRRDTAHATERDRAALLDDLRVRQASMTPVERAVVGRIEGALTRLAGAYEGDLVRGDLTKTPSMVFVRGSLDGFSTVPAIKKSAAASSKDAFVACFVEPPRSRSEPTVLSKVRFIYAGGAFAPGVHRLADAYAALRVLEPGWEARVEAARDEHELLVLKNELDRTPFDKAKQALDAGALLVVIDEAGDAAAPAELDGERPHDVRVAVIDLKSGSTLLRVRRRVDPGSWSQGARTEYAAGLDSCGLAYDLVHPG
jgi:hypothetical protein